MYYFPECIEYKVKSDKKIKSIISSFKSELNKCKSFSEFIELNLDHPGASRLYDLTLANCDSTEAIIYNIMQWKFDEIKLQSIFDTHTNINVRLVALSHIIECNADSNNKDRIDIYIHLLCSFLNINRLEDLDKVSTHNKDIYRYIILRALVFHTMIAIRNAICSSVRDKDILRMTNKLYNLGVYYGKLWDIEFTQAISGAATLLYDEIDLIDSLLKKPYFFEVHNYGFYRLQYQKLMMLSKANDMNGFKRTLIELSRLINMEYTSVPTAIEKFNIYDKCNLNEFLCIVYFVYKLSKICKDIILHIPEKDKLFFDNNMKLHYIDNQPKIGDDYRDCIDRWFNVQNRFYLALLERSNKVCNISTYRKK